MDDDSIKEAILTTCAEVERPALDVAPLPENDLGVAHVCPSCGGLDSLVSESEEDGEIANCPDCGACFTPKIESLARQLIRRLSERREKRAKELIQMAERLSPTPPPGMDPDDYAAFRLAVDGEDAFDEPASVNGTPT
jgi:Zn ribbon nucleic-acid-binding protein